MDQILLEKAEDKFLELEEKRFKVRKMQNIQEYKLGVLKRQMA